jgi:multiple sugar transport system permease protein
MRTSGTVTNAVRLLVLVLGGAVVVFPFVWMLLSSFKSPAEVHAFPPTFLPRTWHPENYAQAWTSTPSTFGRYLLNSAVLAIAGTTLQIVTSVLAAHAFSVMRFPGRRLVFGAFLLTMMIPGEVTLVPNFVTIRHLGLYDSYLGIILPVAASAFSVFLLRQAFRSLPTDYWDAAQLDGCGRLRYLWSIAVPLTRPAITTVMLLAVFTYWNALLWPLIATQSESLRPVQVALIYIQGELGSRVNLLMAAAVISMLPGLVLYIIGQRQFREAMTFAGLRA